ncbi:MAG: tetratricopeptide repeat protein [Planctomycetales bacterium]|nr:tetratricopeptide repeat protein [Planctomycetales bacterium]
MAPEDSPTQPDPQPQAGRFAAFKRFVAGTRRRVLISSTIMLCAVGGVVAAIFSGDNGEGLHEELSVDAVLAALDREEFLQAQMSALQLRAMQPEDYHVQSVAAYVAGVVAVYETDHRWEKDKSSSYLLAAKHLQEARDIGFPEGREGDGLFKLGRCLFEGRQYAESIPVLDEALTQSADHATQVHALLAQAHLLAAEPNPDKALQHNTTFLEDESLDADQRNDALLSRAEILFRLNRVENAHQALAQIPEKSSQRADALVIRGRLLVEAETTDAGVEENDDTEPVSAPRKQNLDEAIRLFREALAITKPNSEATRKANYLIGVALAKKRDWPAALEQFERTRRLFYDAPEGWTSSLHAGDVLRRMEKHEDAIAMYRRAFEAAGSPRTYSNPWLSLDEFRKRMIVAYRAYLDQRDFDRALHLLEGFRPLFTLTHTIELHARVQLAWAQALLAQSQAAPLKNRRVLRREGYEHYRLAGYTFAKLARLRKASEHYPDDLWESATALAEGQDHKNSIRMLEAYIDTGPLRRPAEALVRLGQSQLMVGRLEDAIANFDKCLEFHERDAAVYDARLWSARAHLELGETQAAEELLNTNLVGEGLTPASREWRESLFLLGQVLHESGRHEDAIVKLEESVARDPESSNALLGMYLIAQAYREAAKAPRKRLEEATIESVRLANAKKLRQMLDGALSNYTRLQKQLLQREEGQELAEMEAAMLRNCYFSTGAVLFELGRFDEAIEAFSDATTRFQNEPLVLEAFVQIANSHRRQGRAIEARGALAQARVVLKRLNPELDFTATTNYTHEEWGRVIDQMAQW